MSSISSEPITNKIGSSREGPPARSGEVSSEDELAFAKLLASRVQALAQSSLAQISATESRLQQLAFLNEPASLMLPLFMARRWEPRTSAQTQDLTGEGPSAPSFYTRQGRNPVAEHLGDALKTASEAGHRIDPPAHHLAGVQAATGQRAISKPLSLDAFPRPANDNGRGIHWIPTVSQTREVIDKYIREAKDMGIKWVTFLNEGTNIGANDYLVDQLTQNGIEPVMRVYTDGGAPVKGDLESLVRHYQKRGVHYFQLYNEPNLRIENQGAPPDPKAYAAKWLADARKVVAAGGLPGFGSLSPTPGLAPGAAPGDMDDLDFLREALEEVVRLGGADVLDRTWLSVHNYGTEHLRVREYDRIVRQVLGRSMPQIGTEAGIYPGDSLSKEQATEIVANAYRYLAQREDYYFAYTYWIIANDPGRGQGDPAWNHQALFRPDGHSPLVDILKQEV